MQGNSGIGCLLIDCFTPGEFALSGLCAFLGERGVRAERFVPGVGGKLHIGLQRAYQRVRVDGGTSGVIATGSGIDAALALAVQLPVDRLVLLDAPVKAAYTGPLVRELRRISAYARKNRVFCVSDVLALQADAEGFRFDFDALCRDMPNCRMTRLCVSGNMWTNGKETLKTTIYHFLRDGVLPKSLAENPEMCIIYY